MSDANLMAESYAEEAANLHTTISDDDNKPCCNFCGKKFAQSSYIKAHMRLHTGEKPFACTFCPKRFSDCSNWKKHERIHIRQLGLNPDKPHNLTKHSVYMMQNNFTSPKVKVNESQIQSGVGGTAEFVCKLCGKSFANASSLTTHKRIHSGERPYRCQTCGKSFTQIGTLRTHERVHTGEKPYVCKICGQTFAQSGSFRMHERRHMMEMLHKCPVCPVKFQQWEDAKQHLATHPEILARHPEITDSNGLIESLLINPDQQVSTSQGSDDAMPSIEAYTSRPDQIPPPAFPFPTQMPSLMSAALHFPGAFTMASIAADLTSPLNVFAPHMLRGDALGTLNLPMRPQFSTEITAPSSTSIISLPTITSLSDTQEANDTAIVSTTTARDRKYSSDSPTSRTMSTPEGACDTASMKEEADKRGHSMENMNGDVSHTKQVSEDSSMTSDHSDGTGNDEVIRISRQNLHTRMMSSSNHRKQRHPMRRYSGNGVMVPDTSTQAGSNNSLLETSSVMSDATTTPEEEDDLGEEFTSVSGRFYRCDHCHILFEDCTLYLLHNGFHSHDSDPFKCVICRVSCRDRIEFNCHLTSHINENGGEPE